MVRVKSGVQVNHFRVALGEGAAEFFPGGVNREPAGGLQPLAEPRAEPVHAPPQWSNSYPVPGVAVTLSTIPAK